MYLNDCRKRGLRASTLAYYTGKLANLCAMYGEKIPVSAITPDMLEAFVASGKTPDHNRRISSAFYKFLAEKRIVPPDLFPKVIVPRRKQKIGDLNFGLSGEVADNIAYLKAHPELPQLPA